MDSNRISKIVHQALLERKLSDFYCTSESCKGWERNVVTQPLTVNKIVNAGAERISAGIGVGHELGDRELAGMIDHTLLKPDATIEEIKTLCSEARQYSFASVCVNPCHVKLCSDLLKGTKVKVCTVIGFPLGSNPTSVKRLEAENAKYALAFIKLWCSQYNEQTDDGPICNTLVTTSAAGQADLLVYSKLRSVTESAEASVNNITIAAYQDNYVGIGGYAYKHYLQVVKTSPLPWTKMGQSRRVS